MGIVRLPWISDYWSNQPSVGQSWFRKIFTRNRFQLLLCFFHFVDNTTLARPGTPQYDLAAKFEPLITELHKEFRNHYTPREQIACIQHYQIVKVQTTTDILNRNNAIEYISYLIICAS
jgi:hypothetical protein